MCFHDFCITCNYFKCLNTVWDHMPVTRVEVYITQVLGIPDRQPHLPPLDRPLLLGQQLQELLFFIIQSLSEAWLISMCIWWEVCGLLISWYTLQRCSQLVKLKIIKVHKLANVLWRPFTAWTRISNQGTHDPEWFFPRLKFFSASIVSHSAEA